MTQLSHMPPPSASLHSEGPAGNDTQAAPVDPHLASVAQAIEFLVAHWEEKPSLDRVAKHCGLSPAHFQKMFKAGTGVSPKRFLQFMSMERAREALRTGQSVLEASYAAGLSGPSRLHDLVLAADAVTPGRLRERGGGVDIHYDYVTSPFGEALIGATDKGICWLSFQSEPDGRGLDEMQKDWSGANFYHDPAFVAPLAQSAFSCLQNRGDGPVGLHVRGTNFQLKVWEALLKIPIGHVVTYGDLAGVIGMPKASRAVGAAVGANLISLLIPCHRVILASGVIHNYRWGVGRKRALLAMEWGQRENKEASGQS